MSLSATTSINALEGSPSIHVDHDQPSNITASAPIEVEQGAKDSTRQDAPQSTPSLPHIETTAPSKESPSDGTDSLKSATDSLNTPQIPSPATSVRTPKPGDIGFAAIPTSTSAPEPASSSRRPVPLSSHKPSSSASGLDSLLSPTKVTEPLTSFPRESLATASDFPADDFGDVPLDVDEAHFSTVALSTRDSTTALKSPIGESSAPPWARDLDSDGDLKRSSAATSTFSLNRDSSHRASWLLNRLEHQKQENGDAIHSQRSSVASQTNKIQEEFYRLHSSTPDPEASGVDWEFWGQVVSDYQGFAAENPQKLAIAIEKGIPDSLRGMVWQLMSASKDAELEATYIRLIKEASTHEKAIMRDLGRTFPHHDFFTDGQGIGQENLFNVLKAYSIHDPQVGYCQGLPFVVAVLLLNMPDEEAFSLLVRLMHSYDLRGHFLPEMPKLQLRLFQFDRLIEELLPVLHLHFVRQGIKSSMFCSQWFLTLFSYRFPLEVVYRIFDNCLASGIEAIFGFALALLQKNEEHLLSLKFDELVAFLNAQIIDTYKGKEEGGKAKYRVDEFVRDATAQRITPFMLDTYAHEYAEMVRARDAHLIEVDTLRKSNRNLSSQVNALESNLAQLNQEHVNVLNELVKARLQNEELEGELVRYKLLYAESVHHTEDALSSHRLSTQTATSNGSANSKRPSLQSMLSGFTKSASSS